jgi:hypothetical protein
MIKGLKNRLSDYHFERLPQSIRDVVACNITKAKTVGIVYFADKEEDTTLVKRYINHLKTYDIKVSALGYYRAKDLHRDIVTKLGMDYFCFKDINAHLRPISSTVQNFVDIPFDILIDTSVMEDKSIRFVTTLSKSKFKVGYTQLPYAKHLDFTINLPEGETVRELIKNIDRYLHIINK